MFQSPFAESIVSRAQTADLVKIYAHDLRNWTDDKRKTVDDKPFGGGPGMVMMVEPFDRALAEIKSQLEGKQYRTILTSAKGQPFKQNLAEAYSKLDALIILCGHYEGVDERVAQFLVDQEVSIGDYVVTGGELPAMIIADATIRLLDGVLGNQDSLLMESHTKATIEYPQYTRPASYKSVSGEIWEVPPVLINGDHKQIDIWRSAQSIS